MIDIEKKKAEKYRKNGKKLFWSFFYLCQGVNISILLAFVALLQLSEAIFDFSNMPKMIFGKEIVL